MKKAVFLLVQDPEDPCRDMICHRDGNLRIKVYCVDKEDFEPNPDELQFYAQDHDQTLAFETSNFDMEEPGLIIEAIRWYSNYIENPQMEILPEDPRETHE